MTNYELVSNPLSETQARATCEEAADAVVARNGGHWEWLDERRLCVYSPLGELFATFHMDQMQ